MELERWQKVAIALALTTSIAVGALLVYSQYASAKPVTHIESWDVKGDNSLGVIGDITVEDGLTKVTLTYRANVGVPPASPVTFYSSFNDQKVINWVFSDFHTHNSPIGCVTIVYKLNPGTTRIDCYYSGQQWGWDDPYYARDALSNLGYGDHEVHATFSGFDLSTPPILLVKEEPELPGWEPTYYFRKASAGEQVAMVISRALFPPEYVTPIEVTTTSDLETSVK